MFTLRVTTPAGELLALIHVEAAADWSEVTGIGPVPAGAELALEAMQLVIRPARTRAAPRQSGPRLAQHFATLAPGDRVWLKA